jgi:hypothetical protein
MDGPDDNEENSLKHHNPAWLTELLPNRLYVAAFPTKEDALYYSNILRAGYVINLTEFTNQTTASGKNNKNEWYTAFWRNCETIRMIREPLPADHSTQSDTNRVKTYVAIAKRVTALMKVNPNTLFVIHNRTGCDDEAIIGLLTWYLVDKASFPREGDLRDWQKQHHCTRLLDDEDQRALFEKCIEEIKSTSNRIMDSFVKRQKRK